MEITSNGYKGNERRQCNEKARLKLSLWEWIRLSIWAIVIIATSVTAWITTKGSISANAQEIKVAKKIAEKNEATNQTQNDDILVLQTDLKTIQKDVDKLVRYREEDKNLLLEIYREVKND